MRFAKEDSLDRIRKANEAESNILGHGRTSFLIQLIDEARAEAASWRDVACDSSDNISLPWEEP